MTLNSEFPEVAFGTSGVRALVDALTPQAVSAYVFSFVERMYRTGHLAAGGRVAIGMDLRPSSPDIALAAGRMLQGLGHDVVFLGRLPTPALALHCLSAAVPGIMVTGSHIPFDRNGMKFYRPDGEILKDDEQAMSALHLPAEGLWPGAAALPAETTEAVAAYIRRYADHWGREALSGLRVGLYQHSAVGRDVTCAILEALGATVIPLGRSDTFIPIDTEAVGEDDLTRARQWCAGHSLDALVSTDGDGDRPLVFDAKGNFIHGDLLGLVCARALGITALAIPVSCNTAIEKSESFRQVLRTRIGSPYVIDGMHALMRGAEGPVAGFEANGGFLLATPVQGMRALPTRDAVLPMVTILAAAAASQRSLAALIDELPRRFTHSDRIKGIPAAVSRALLEQLAGDSALRAAFFPGKSANGGVDLTDGVRLVFQDQEIVHLRASGNAPELRCYAEAETYEEAKQLCANTLQLVKNHLRA